MDSFVAEIRKISPVTRILCASSLGITIPVLMNILSPYKVLFVRELVLQKFEARLLLFHATLQSRPLLNRYGDFLQVFVLEVSLATLSTVFWRLKISLTLQVVVSAISSSWQCYSE